MAAAPQITVTTTLKDLEDYEKLAQEQGAPSGNSAPTVQLFYGVAFGDRCADVTDALGELTVDGRLQIPANDNIRYRVFGKDPAPRYVKNVFVCGSSATQPLICVCFSAHHEINLSIANIVDDLKAVVCNRAFNPSRMYPHVDARLDAIHQSLCFTGVPIQDELPEQLLSVEFICSDNIVVEIGGNYGRNSMVMERLGAKVVVFECEPETAKRLAHNRDTNKMTFEIVTAALSKKPLMMAESADTQVACVVPAPENGEPLPAGHYLISTVTWQEFQAAHPLPFNTLVADCEGALPFILAEFPEMLEGIHTIIMENDYKVMADKVALNKILMDAGFRVKKRVAGGWGPCRDYFYQVWYRK